MPPKEKPVESSQDVTSLVAVMKDMMAMQQRAMLNQQQAMADQQQAYMQEMKLLCEAIARHPLTTYVNVGDDGIPDRQNTPKTSSVSAPKISVKQPPVLSESMTLPNFKAWRKQWDDYYLITSRLYASL